VTLHPIRLWQRFFVWKASSTAGQSLAMLEPKQPDNPTIDNYIEVKPLRVAKRAEALCLFGC
jgi:hypothetical protein